MSPQLSLPVPTATSPHYYHKTSLGSGSRIRSRKMKFPAHSRKIFLAQGSHVEWEELVGIRNGSLGGGYCSANPGSKTEQKGTSFAHFKI